MTRKDAYVILGILFIMMFLVLTYGLTKSLLEDDVVPMRTETVEKVTPTQSTREPSSLTGKATLYWHCGDKVCSSE